MTGAGPHIQTVYERERETHHNMRDRGGGGYFKTKQKNHFIIRKNLVNWSDFGTEVYNVITKQNGVILYCFCFV
jgi:hypothetical protein